MTNKNSPSKEKDNSTHIAGMYVIVAAIIGAVALFHATKKSVDPGATQIVPNPENTVVIGPYIEGQFNIYPAEVDSSIIIKNQHCDSLREQANLLYFKLEKKYINPDYMNDNHLKVLELKENLKN